ncbi:MAG: hypothetical protein R3B09_13415 [Nannocystaceae bacterium]
MLVRAALLVPLVLADAPVAPTVATEAPAAVAPASSDPPPPSDPEATPSGTAGDPDARAPSTTDPNDDTSATTDATTDAEVYAPLESEGRGPPPPPVRVEPRATRDAEAQRHRSYILAGGVLTGVGGTLALAGSAVYLFDRAEARNCADCPAYRPRGYEAPMLVGGFVLLAVGVPLLVIGRRLRREWIGRGQARWSLAPTLSARGLGLGLGGRF